MTSHPADPYEKYFSGQALLGDDFTQAEIIQWYDDERDAYANLGAKDRSSYKYHYHALNRYHAFNRLDPKRFYEHACGFGSAYGDELLPLKNRLKRVTIIDSSNRFDSVIPLVDAGVKATFVAARPDGMIQVDSESFDLITCFGVLHHIPNVSYVVSELARCLGTNGMLLIREPTTSMGDWRRARSGLTRHERGIPEARFHEILTKNNLRILHRSICVFPPLSALLSKMGISAYSHQFFVHVDHILCWLTSWNYRYHRTNLLSRFASASMFYICTK